MNNQQNNQAYRGNVQGNYQGSQSASTYGGSQSGQSAGSQYRAMQSSFQPTGNVQSFYGQQNQTGSNGTPQSTTSFQGTNYKGNQQGHDADLRADSTSPSNLGTGSFSNGMRSGTMR